MNVRFHHERTGTQCFDGFGNDVVSFSDDDLTDDVDGLWLQQTDVLANSSPPEFGVFVPRTDARDGSQFVVVFGQLLQMVVRVITAQTNTGQHRNLPVIHSFATAVRTCVAVDVLFNEAHDSVGDLRLRVHILQSSQHAHDAVATVEIQLDLIDGKAVQTQLSRVRFSQPWLLED